jgi:hypothetical protein
MSSVSAYRDSMKTPQQHGQVVDIEAIVVPEEVTITHRVGRGVAISVLVIGQLVSSVWMLVIEFTSGSRMLSRSAFLGYLAYSVTAWWVAQRHPGRAVLVMAGGCALLFGLLVLAAADGWLGA